MGSIKTVRHSPGATFEEGANERRGSIKEVDHAEHIQGPSDGVRVRHRHAPKLKVHQGESFVVNTEDAASGLIRSKDVTPHINDFPTRKFEPPKSNPIGGPIYVEG